MMRGIALRGRGFDLNMECDRVVAYAVEIMRLATWSLASSGGY